MTVALATTVVSPHTVASPYVATKAVLVGAGVMAAAALGTLGVLAVYRRRPTLEQAADTGPQRTGLLDATRSDLTRLR